MTFDQAIVKAIKTFLKGDMPPKLMELAEGNLKYTPEYLDEYAEKVEMDSDTEEEEAVDEQTRTTI